MNKAEDAEIVSDLLNNIHKLLIELEAIGIKATISNFKTEARIKTYQTESIAENAATTRDHGVCFEAIQNGFRVYHRAFGDTNNLMFGDTKLHNFLDKILAFFGWPTIKLLKFGIISGRYYIGSCYVGREEFVDYVKDNYPDIFQWCLFNPEML